MPFCINCGQQFPNGAKFCPECGTPTTGTQSKSQDQRSQSFAGEIRKCPNCGEALSAFELKCHACGFELRNTKASTAVQEFYNKIEQIEEGRDERKPGETEKRISNVIRNYPIPNTKEDVLEFMMLASSNIDVDIYATHGSRKKAEEYQYQKLVADAWRATAEQVYHKAEVSFGDDPAFSTIEEIYTKKITSIASAKRQGTIKDVFSGISSFFKGMKSTIGKNKDIFLLLLLPFLMLIPVLLGIAPGLIMDMQSEKKLEAIVAEIQEYIAKEDYDAAYIKAQTLYMEGNGSSSEHWNKVREDLIDMIETKSGVSYTSKTSLSDLEDPPTSNSAEEESSSPSMKEVFSDMKDTIGESMSSAKDSVKEAFSGIFE